ncbi:unnamed protein product [Chrysoparadoxa australica]
MSCARRPSSLRPMKGFAGWPLLPRALYPQPQRLCTAVEGAALAEQEKEEERIKRHARDEVLRAKAKRDFEMAEKYYGWYYKMFGVFSEKSVRLRKAAALFRVCQEQVIYPAWTGRGAIGKDFRSQHMLLSLHVWIIHRRMVVERFKDERSYIGEMTTEIQEYLFEELWEDTRRRMRHLNVEELMIKKRLQDVQEYTMWAMCKYDDALEGEMEEEVVQALAEAIHKYVYLDKEKGVTSEFALVLAKYALSELKDVLDLEVQGFLDGCMRFGQPPTWEAFGFPQTFAPEELAVTRWRRLLHLNGKPYWWNRYSSEVRWDHEPWMDEDVMEGEVEAIGPAPERRHLYEEPRIRLALAEEEDAKTQGAKTTAKES